MRGWVWGRVTVVGGRVGEGFAATGSGRSVDPDLGEAGCQVITVLVQSYLYTPSSADQVIRYV